MLRAWRHRAEAVGSQRADPLADAVRQLLRSNGNEMEPQRVLASEPSTLLIRPICLDRYGLEENFGAGVPYKTLSRRPHTPAKAKETSPRSSSEPSGASDQGFGGLMRLWSLQGAEGSGSFEVWGGHKRSICR